MAGEPAAESALLSIIESVAAPLWVLVLFAETPSYQTIIGGSVVLGTIIVYTSLELRRRAVLA